MKYRNSFSCPCLLHDCWYFSQSTLNYIITETILWASQALSWISIVVSIYRAAHPCLVCLVHVAGPHGEQHVDPQQPEHCAEHGRVIAEVSKLGPHRAEVDGVGCGEEGDAERLTGTGRAAATRRLGHRGRRIHLVKNSGIRIDNI